MTMQFQQGSQFFQHFLVGQLLAPCQDDFARPPKDFRFHDAFKRAVGMSAKQFREKMRQ